MYIEICMNTSTDKQRDLDRKIIYRYEIYYLYRLSVIFCNIK